MGITGLLPMLKGACLTVNLSDLQGTTAVIDTYGWLHKSLFPVSLDLYQGKPVNAHITFCIRRVQELRKHRIKPIFVFDGQNLPAKCETERQRRENRAKAKIEVDKLIARKNMSEARRKVHSAVDITQEIAVQLIKRLQEDKIDYIVAPYEADAQMAYMVRNGFADFAISEDSDLILFGCPFVLYKLDYNGQGELLIHDRIAFCECFEGPLVTAAGDNSNERKLDFENFRRFCILSGCDYLPNIPGVGLAKAKKFISTIHRDLHDLSRSLKRLPSELKMKVEVSDEYIRKFIEAELTFKFQLVFCPHERKLKPLNDYDEHVSDIHSMQFAGSYRDEAIALQCAFGNVRFDDDSILDASSQESVLSAYSEMPTSIWNRDYVLKDAKLMHKLVKAIEDTISDEPPASFFGQEMQNSNKRRRLSRDSSVSRSQDSNESNSQKSFSSQKVKHESKQQTMLISGKRNQPPAIDLADDSDDDMGVKIVIEEKLMTSSYEVLSPESDKSLVTVRKNSSSNSGKVFVKSRFFKQGQSPASTANSYNVLKNATNESPPPLNLKSYYTDRESQKRKVAMLYNAGNDSSLKHTSVSQASSIDSGFESRSSQ